MNREAIFDYLYSGLGQQESRWMTVDDPLTDIEKIREAVSESGFVLEYEIASMLESQDWNVIPSFNVKDIDTGKSRELDIYAYKVQGYNDRFVRLGLIIECKTASHPTVFFTRSFLRHPVFPAAFKISVSEEIQKEKKRREWLEDSIMRQLDPQKLCFELAMEEYATQFCQLERKGNDRLKAYRDGGPITSLLKKTHATIMDRTEQFAPIGKRIDVSIFWTIMVCKAPIYICKGNPESLAETDCVTLFQHYTSSTLEGEFWIRVVRDTALEDFLSREVYIVGESIYKEFQELELEGIMRQM